MVNLLPAACNLADSSRYTDVEALMGENGKGILPDLAYVVAAIDAGIPVVNFTPNTVELPGICDLAVARGVPIAGRDGKTGRESLKHLLPTPEEAGLTQ